MDKLDRNTVILRMARDLDTGDVGVFMVLFHRWLTVYTPRRLAVAKKILSHCVLSHCTYYEDSRDANILGGVYGVYGLDLARCEILDVVYKKVPTKFDAVTLAEGEIYHV